MAHNRLDSSVYDDKMAGSACFNMRAITSAIMPSSLAYLSSAVSQSIVYPVIWSRVSLFRSLKLISKNNLPALILKYLNLFMI